MQVSLPLPEGGEQQRVKALQRVLLGGIVCSLAVIFSLLFYRNIHWDEFYFLSKIYKYHGGTLSSPFQTFYVHLFGWLLGVSKDEISLILIGRCVCFVLFLGSISFLYLISRLFFHPISSLFSVLTFITFSEVIDHGAAFRVEPLVLFLFLAAVYLLLKPELSFRRTIFIGTITSLAMMFTIKSLFLLMFLIILFSSLVIQGRARFNTLVVFFTACCLSFLGFYLFHRFSLVFPHATARSLVFEGRDFFWLGERAQEMFVVFGQRNVAKRNLALNPIQWSFIIGGAIFFFRRVGKEQRVLAMLLFVSGAFFVLSVTFYRNSFAYYYPLILSLIALFSAVIAEKCIKDFYKTSSSFSLIFCGCLAGGLFFSVLCYLQTEFVDGIKPQREVLNVVHQIFPTPVSYLDRSSMVASFPNAGSLLSTLQLERYRQRGVPMMKELFVKSPPIFILINSEALHFLQGKSTPSIYRLLSEDVDALKNNYIEHWGLLFVAGKQFNFDGVADLQLRKFDILIPGLYTFESKERALLDGEPVFPGAQRYLEGGEHTVLLNSPAKLRWGKSLFRPAFEPSSQPIFVSY